MSVTPRPASGAAVAKAEPDGAVVTNEIRKRSWMDCNQSHRTCCWEPKTEAEKRVCHLDDTGSKWSESCRWQWSREKAVQRSLQLPKPYSELCKAVSSP